MSPVLVDQYGGLCTLIDRSDLPVGLSPDCRNVEFFPGGVRSRSGFVVHQAAGISTEDLMSHVTVDGQRLLLALGGGSIVGGAVESAPAAIPFGNGAASTTALGSSLRMRGTSLFGRAYFGLYGGWAAAGTAAVYEPICGPFKYNGAGISPVSQAPPPAAFTVTNTAAGASVDAGRHDFVVLYETDTGYVTAPSPPVGDTFIAGDRADLAALPLGPGLVSKRIVFATPANSVSFFTLPRFVVPDNSTTVLSLDFTDSELMAGTSLEDYIDSPRIPPVVGVEKYGRRLVYWGGKDRIISFFDSDATTPTTPVTVGLTCLDFDEQITTLPAVWVPTGAGGAVVTQAGAALQVYQITGDGATATRGQIDQVALNVAYSGTQYIQAARIYSMRIRIRRNSTLAAGRVTVTIRGSATNVAGSGSTITTLDITKAMLVLDEWYVFTSSFSPVVATGYAYVNATILADGTPTNGGVFQIDYIEIFDATQPASDSLLWVTPPDSPETLNLSTGTVSIAESDGQRVTNMFELRGNLYVCKENSLYVTTDNGEEPAFWAVDQVSAKIGCVGPHGVALGDGWALIVDRSGLYYFTGGVPEKISQEIQPTWDARNWGWSAKTWIAIDAAAKKAYIGIPGPTSVDVVRIFVLDFVEGFGDPVSAGGSGRKWTEWYFGIPFDGSIHAGIMAERAALNATFFTTFLGNILVQSATAPTDTFGGNFNAYYETAPIGTEIGRSLFDRVVFRVRGAGDLLSYYRPPGGTLTTLPTKTLAASPDDDIELRMRSIQTQNGFRVGTVASGEFWSLRRLAVFLRPSEYSLLRKT